MAGMEIPEETLESYIRSEFNAMDSNQDGKLHRNEVLKLLTLLGYDKGEQKLKVCIQISLVFLQF